MAEGKGYGCVWLCIWLGIRIYKDTIVRKGYGQGVIWYPSDTPGIRRGIFAGSIEIVSRDSHNFSE